MRGDEVTRLKNRWKCTLEDGVVPSEGQDCLFSRALGEMQVFINSCTWTRLQSIITVVGKTES
jgi:hypothetical protein